MDGTATSRETELFTPANKTHIDLVHDDKRLNRRLIMGPS